MKILKLSLLLLFIFCSCISVNSQNSVQVEVYPHQAITLSYERFDINAFRSKTSKSGSIDYVYTESDGTQKRISNLRRGQPIEVYETPPLPALYRIFKEFYPNGNLKQKGLYLPLQFRIGKWLECDERGNCYVVNYDIYRGSFGYNSLLKMLEDKGYLNTKTGAGNWSFTIWYNDNSRQWGVKLQKDSKYKTFEIKGDSGEIVSESGYESTPVKSIHGEYIAPE